MIFEHRCIVHGLVEERDACEGVGRVGGVTEICEYLYDDGRPCGQPLYVAIKDSKRHPIASGRSDKQ